MNEKKRDQRNYEGIFKITVYKFKGEFSSFGPILLFVLVNSISNQMVFYSFSYN